MKDKIYIVCNSSLAIQLKKIAQFKLNLGMSLSDSSMKINTPDIIIQTHHMHHSRIIQMIGFLGSLPVYSHPSYNTSLISICCEEHLINHKLEGNDIYSNINTALDKMFNHLGINKPKEIKTEITVTEYVKPNKLLKEMTEAERLAYARNLK